jgi:hypothetical protein
MLFLQAYEKDVKIRETTNHQDSRANAKAKVSMSSLRIVESWRKQTTRTATINK